MEFADLQQRLNKVVERYDSQTFLGSFRETGRSSLLKDGLSTRANSLWKMAEFVVARKDDESPDGADSGYLHGWQTLASNYNNQYLLLESNAGEWEIYNARGVKLGDNDFIKEFLEGKRVAKIAGVPKLNWPSQQITYGAPGTGKSHRIQIEIKNHVVYRTTFHPDSDYSTFVGAYKPTMSDDAGRIEVYKETGGGRALDVTHEIKKGISYDFVPQAFIKAYVDAWQKMDAVAEGAAPVPVFLVIEEINRGNCAQIFGDFFQLLDRTENGYSDYPIDADSDLKRFLSDTKRLGSLSKIREDVRKGVKLVLPPNLYVWATMNTSDQSLFPMDSAFKRRWDWKYVPISEGVDKDSKKPLGWKIKFNVPVHQENGQQVAAKEYSCNWWKFLVEINKVVKSVTNSADKRLGYFFVKARDGVIDAEMFVNKVAFYLWNDVFRDCELDGEAFKFERDGRPDVLAFQDFFEENGTIDEVVLKGFLEKLVPPSTETTPVNDSAPAVGGAV